MGTRRGSRIKVVAGLLAVVIALALPGTTGATTTHRYVGPAPGAVTCKVSATLKFSPALKGSGGGTSRSSLKGKLFSCTTGNAAVTITKGKLKGFFAKSPLVCSTLSSGLASGSFTVSWKGLVNGTIGSKTYSGKAKLTPSTLTNTGERVTTDASGHEGLVIPGVAETTFDSGSFSPGGWTTSLFGADDGSTLAALCDSPKGIKKLALTGTITLPTSGTLWAWGDNRWGEIGDGTLNQQVYPEEVSGVQWAHVSAGGNYAVGIKTDGTLWAWGDNYFGQLGVGTDSGPGNCNSLPCSDVPVQVGTDTNWAQVSAGPEQVAAIKTDGTLWAWGDNSYGQLGNGSALGPETCDLGACSTVPVQVGTDTDWAQVSVAGYQTVAIKTGGTLWAWGWDQEGVLGDGADTSQYSPEQVGTESDWAQASAGGTHTVAIKTDGTLWAWGDDLEGELGIGTDSGLQNCGIGPCTEVPIQVGTETDWAQVKASLYQTVAIKDDGTLWAWGSNEWGQLGIGTNSGPDTCAGPCSTAPIQVGSDTDWEQVSPGFYYVLGLKTDGTLWAWGRNNYGQLGDGTTTDQYTPEQISSSTHWFQVSAGTVNAGENIGPSVAIGMPLDN